MGIDLRVKHFLGLLALSFPLAELAAQGTLEISSPGDQVNIDRYLQYWIDQKQSATLQEALSLDGKHFRSMGEEGLRLPPGSPPIWLKFKCRSTFQYPATFMLDFLDPALFNIQLYQQLPNGTFQKFESGAGIAPSKKAVEGNRNNFLIELEPRRETLFVARVYSLNYITISAQLMDVQIALSRSLHERVFLGMFYGILLILVVYNVLLFTTTGSNPFLLIGIYTLLVGVFTGASDGFSSQYLFFLVEWSKGYQDIPIATALNVLGLWFMTDFLKVKQWSDHFYTFLKWLPPAIVASVIIVTLLHLPATYDALVFIGLLTLGVTLSGGILAVKRKVPQSAFFVVAYTLYGFFVIIFILSLLRILPFGFLIKYAIHFGFLSCIAILSYGLGVRIYGIYLNSLDREKEKQAIITKKNQELEEKVKERTRDIFKKEINLRSILDNSDNSIWLVDKHYRLIDFNAIFLEEWKLAYNLELAVGVKLLECIPDEKIKKTWEKRYALALTSKKAVYQDMYELAGEKHYYEIHVYPISEAGEVNGISFFAKDVTVRVEAQKKLEEQNRTLTKVNRELDSFVYSASHDLKAPLASVLGLITLSRMENDPTIQQEYYEMMEKSVVRLDQFIEDIIDYSRNSRIKVKPGSIELENMVYDVFDDLKYIDGADELEKEVDINENRNFKTDPIRLKVILRNILSNAIRYGCLGSRIKKIEIKAQVGDDRLRLSIKDHGPGIPGDQHYKIFDMFYRAHEGLTGTGLGLYIVKETVEKLEGTVEVRSQPKEGAEFLIEIPGMP